ncbi:hypothetical protein CO540_08280 [Micromonospora sp. WMMA2032]|nr:hypothetical protein CO540_08280 [Micromonospora sp. WMMA2032]
MARPGPMRFGLARLHQGQDWLRSPPADQPRAWSGALVETGTGRSALPVESVHVPRRTTGRDRPDRHMSSKPIYR